MHIVACKDLSNTNDFVCLPSKSLKHNAVYIQI